MYAYTCIYIYRERESGLCREANLSLFQDQDQSVYIYLWIDRYR